MPRAKKNGRFPPRGGKGGKGNRGGQGSVLRFVSASNTAPESSSFTLADEALQTSRQDHSSWAANSILRSKPVKFISAGTSEPLKALSNLSKPADVQKLPSSSSQEGNRLSDVGTLDVIVGPVPLSSEVHSKDELLSGEELRRDLDVSHGPETRSEDCGFFFDLGTKAQRSVSPKSPLYLPARSLSPCSSSSDEVILFKGRDAPKREDLTTGLTFSQSHITTQSSKDERKFTSMAKVSRQSAEVNRPARERFGKLLDQNDSGNDALVADYIENMRENGEIDGLLLSDTRNMRDLGGSESMSTRSHSDKDDFKDENQGDMGVRSENRSQEKQGQEASTLPGNLDIDVSLEGKCNNSDMYRSEGELDDETLARLIAGQDLGPDNDYDPDDMGSSDSDDSLSFSKQTTTRPYPNVDEFDYMDWNRASLHRKKGKAARAKFAFSVSDSELEQTLQVAWNHDRMRKAQRKQQREELRALGQLGRGSEKPDLKVKYSTGMNMQQVAEEFKAFLLGNEDSVTLPPMDNHARKMIHELANKLMIKSKSAGKGDQRRPVLHRTKRTPPFAESTFEQAVARINRRYFPRQDKKGKKSKAVHSQRAGHAEATVQDGEIVGAAAPELGIDNRGRAMLEKMGWSSGTALGSVNNKGILQPVSQAMKRSKAGLG